VSDVPILTGPTTAATSSGNYGPTYLPWQAFDNNLSTFWLSAANQTAVSLGYAFTDGAHTIRRYAITYSNGPSLSSRAPRDWTLQGSNDGTNFNVLDTRSAQTNWGATGVERREFSVASPAAFTSYRLLITDDNDSRAGAAVVVISIGELQLYSN